MIDSVAPFTLDPEHCTARLVPAVLVYTSHSCPQTRLHIQAMMRPYTKMATDWNPPVCEERELPHTNKNVCDCGLPFTEKTRNANVIKSACDGGLGPAPYAVLIRCDDPVPLSESVFADGNCICRMEAARPRTLLGWDDCRLKCIRRGSEV